jgi:hypothetical protein
MKAPNRWSHRMLFEAKKQACEEITAIASMNNEQLFDEVKKRFPGCTLSKNPNEAREGLILWLCKDIIETNFPVNMAAI